MILDTPGIHKPHHLLGERLVQSARRRGEVDQVLLLEGHQSPGRGDAFIVNLLRQQRLPVQVVLNKWDLVPVDRKPGGCGLSRVVNDTEWPVHHCSALDGYLLPQVVSAVGALMPGPGSIRPRWSVISPNGC